jgi:hypothetical protein
VEPVFWLLLYWAMVMQPGECSEEEINVSSWDYLNGNHKSRRGLVLVLRWILPNITHSFYKPLQPLITELTSILLVDRH